MPYLVAVVLLEMIQEKGKEVIDQLHWAQGGRAPYFINAPAENILGQNYAKKFEQAKINLNNLALQQIEKLKTQANSNLIDLELPGIEAYAPSISPDGLKLIYIEKDETSRRALQLLERPNVQVAFTKEHLKKSFADGEAEEAQNRSSPKPGSVNLRGDGPPGGSILRISWFPDSKKIIYDKVDRLNRFEEFSDLYTYDFESNKSEQLSIALRAREPVVSPDGKKILFVKLQGGRTALATFDLDNKRAEIIWHAGWQERISFPIYKSENEIYFSLHKDGSEQLWQLDLATKTARALTTPANSYQPQINNNQLSFISRKTGVANIYTNNLPQTNVLTSIQSYTWDKEQKEYVVSVLTGSGQKLFRTTA
jgi:Tol biopolymer transport system component